VALRSKAAAQANVLRPSRRRSRAGVLEPSIVRDVLEEDAERTAPCLRTADIQFQTERIPRQRRFIYRVSALAFWTTYLILSIARRALRALSHRKFTLHFLTKISTRQALCASPFRGRRQAAALIFYFPTLTSLYTFGRAPNDVVVPTVIQHPNMDVTSHPSVRDTFGG
jgi:hypothetical protein